MPLNIPYVIRRTTPTDSQEVELLKKMAQRVYWTEYGFTPELSNFHILEGGLSNEGAYWYANYVMFRIGNRTYQWYEKTFKLEEYKEA